MSKPICDSWSLKEIFFVLISVILSVLIILWIILYTNISDNVALYSAFGSLIQAVAAIVMIIATTNLSIKQFHLIEKQNSIALIEKRINTRKDIDNIVKVIINLLHDIKNTDSYSDNNLKRDQMYDQINKFNLNKEYITILFNKNQYEKIDNILDDIGECFKRGTLMNATLSDNYSIASSEEERKCIISKYKKDCYILTEEINKYKKDFDEIYINCMQM